MTISTARLHGFVSAVGSGGTLAGVGMALKERNPNIKIALADPLGAALYSYLHDGRTQELRLLDHRGHRPGPDHRQSGRRAGRFRLPNSRRGGAADRLRSGGPGRAAARRFVGDQHRRRDPSRPRTWSRPHDRDAALRFRRPLRFQAVQSRLPALEEPARSGLAGSERRARPRCSCNDAGPVSRGRLSGRDGSDRALVRTARHCARSHGLLPAGRRTERRSEGRSCSKTGRRFRSSTRSTTPTARPFCMCQPKGPPCPARRARDRPHRLGAALQAHARPYRAASALGRRALSGDGRIGRRRGGAARFRFGRGGRSTKRRSSAGSTN